MQGLFFNYTSGNFLKTNKRFRLVCLQSLFGCKIISFSLYVCINKLKFYFRSPWCSPYENKIPSWNDLTFTGVSNNTYKVYLGVKWNLILIQIVKALVPLFMPDLVSSIEKEFEQENAEVLEILEHLSILYLKTNW